MARSSTDRVDDWLATVGPGDAFAALSGLMPEAVVMVVDADRNVVLWSDGAERLLGFSADEAIGNHCLKSHRCSECMGRCGISEFGSVTRSTPTGVTRRKPALSSNTSSAPSYRKRTRAGSPPGPTRISYASRPLSIR